jgi:hypothetical protein
MCENGYLIGDDWVDTYTWQDNVGTAIDLTSITIRSGIKKNYTDTDYAIDPTDITITKLNQTTNTGQFTVLFPNSKTSLLELGCYFMEIEIVSGGLITTILQEKIQVLPQILT